MVDLNVIEKYICTNAKIHKCKKITQIQSDLIEGGSELVDLNAIAKVVMIKGKFF